MKPAYARLHVLLAREAPLGLVIRHGSEKSVCTLLWDREKDTFQLGQWMRGRIAVDRCDLSPNGKYFIYCGVKRRSEEGTWKTHAWTAVSRTPYLTALAYYPERWGGGLFVDNRHYWARGRSAAGDLESPEVQRVELADPPKGLLKDTFWVRDGWLVEDRRAFFNGRLAYVRSAGAGWELRRFEVDRFAYRLVCGARAWGTRGWDWADMVGDRLVWAVKGCLWSGRLGADGIQQNHLLHDFNGMKFEPLAAPYEAGKPVEVQS